MTEMKTTVDVIWKDGAIGQGELTSTYLNTKIAIPKTLGGSGEGANPKELLVSSAASCYIATLVYMLENRKLPVDSFTMKTEASVSKAGFKIIHYPIITLTAEATDAQVEATKRAFEGADKGCDIGNLLKVADVSIVVEGTVVT